MGIYGTRDGIFAVKKLAVKDKLLSSYVIDMVATVSTGGLAGGLDINAATTAKIAKDFSAQPPYPLNVGVTTNTSPALTTDRVRVTGYDAQGTLRYEDVKIASTVASTYYSNYSYAQVTSLEPYTSAGVLGTSATDDIGVGWGNIAGLPHPIASSGDLIAYVTGSAAATTMPTVTLAYDQVTVAGVGTAVPLGAHILYMTEFQKR